MNQNRRQDFAIQTAIIELCCVYCYKG